MEVRAWMCHFPRPGPPWSTPVTPGSRSPVGTPVRAAAVPWEGLRHAGRRALLPGALRPQFVRKKGLEEAWEMCGKWIETCWSGTRTGGILIWRWRVVISLHPRPGINKRPPVLSSLPAAVRCSPPGARVTFEDPPAECWFCRGLGKPRSTCRCRGCPRCPWLDHLGPPKRARHSSVWFAVALDVEHIVAHGIWYHCHKS